MSTIFLTEKFTCKTSSKFLIILTNYSCESIDILREYNNYIGIYSTYTRSVVTDNDKIYYGKKIRKVHNIY